MATTMEKRGMTYICEQDALQLVRAKAVDDLLQDAMQLEEKTLTVKDVMARQRIAGDIARLVGEMETGIDLSPGLMLYGMKLLGDHGFSAQALELMRRAQAFEWGL